MRLCLTSLICAVLAVTTGCATLEGPPDPHDPWESFNRSIYRFNDSLDRAVLRPVAQGYRYVTPDPVETGVGNFFSNLGEIRNLINNLLQFKPAGALSSTGRLLINSTIGIAGIFDVATPIGLSPNDEDFGQTLGRWGLDTGPYLVLPFLGSSSVRDGFGRIPDYYLNPIREVEENRTRTGLYVVDVVSTRARLLEAGEILDEAAMDPYIFVREAYLQRRKNKVYDGNPPMETPDEEIDIFSDD